MFNGLGTFLNTVLVIIAISVPLAIWKLIDIIIWIFNNVKIQVG